MAKKPIDGLKWVGDTGDFQRGTVGDRNVFIHDMGPPEVKHPGGRPREKDWDAWYREVVAVANKPDGLPKTQADLERHMLDWCQEHMEDPPGETATREKVREIYRHVFRS